MIASIPPLPVFTEPLPDIDGLGLSREEAFLLYLFAFYDAPLEEEFLLQMGTGHLASPPASREAIRSAIASLLKKRHILRTDFQKKASFYIATLWKKRPVLRYAVLRHANQRKWCVACELSVGPYFNLCLRSPNRGLESWYRESVYGTGRFLQGLVSGDVDEFNDGLAHLGFRGLHYLYDDRCCARTAVLQLVSDSLFPHGDEPRGAFGPAMDQVLLPFRLYRTFANGRDCRPLLREILPALSKPDAFLSERPSAFPRDTLYLVGALCVWCGEPALLADFRAIAETFGRDALKKGYDFFRHCLGGAFDRAEKAAPGVLRTMRETYDRAEVRFTHLGFPAMLLGILVRSRWEQSYAVIEKMHTRLSLVSDHLPLAAAGDPGACLDEFGDYLSDCNRESFVNSLGNGAVPVSALPYVSTLLNLRTAWQNFSAQEKRIGKIAPFALPAAEAALAAGYPFIAAGIAGLVLGNPDCTARARALLERTSALGVQPFLRVLPPQMAWEAVLEKVAREFPAGAAKAGKPRARAAAPKTLGWHLVLEKTETPDVFALEGIRFTLHAEKAGVLGPGSSVSPKKAASLATGTFATETEKNATIALQAALKGVTYFHDSMLDGDRGRTVLEYLVGHPCVFADAPRTSKKKADAPPAVPVEIVRAEAAFATAREADGTLRVTPPPGRPSLYPLLRRLADNRYEVVVYGKAARRLHEIFSECDVEPSGLVIPADRVADASRILCAAAETVPLSGEITAAGDAATLRHLPADATLRARARLDGDVLEVTLRVQPDPAVPVRFEPGRGNAPVIGRLDGEGVVYDRDLSAEHAAAKAVRAILGGVSPDAEAEPFRWRFESLYQSLEALDRLHSWKGLALEWLDGSQRIQVATPRSAHLQATQGADYWFGIQGEFELDTGKLLSFLDLLKRLPERAGRYIPLSDGLFLRVTQSMLHRLEALSAAGASRGDELRLNPAAVPMLDDAFHGPVPAGDAPDAVALDLPDELEAATGRFREAFAADIAVPEDLHATLRPYQEEGYRWLARLARCGIGACLADDMGLGKTLQIIALLLARASEGPSLVIAPASVCGNWVAEIRRFAPSLDPVLVTVQSRGLPRSEEPEAPRSPDSRLVVVASYGLLVSREGQFASRTWNGVVLDEAQSIKNHASKRAHAAKRLRGAFRIVATGTPVENRLSELWSLFDFLNPGLLRSHEAFLKTFTEEGMATPALKRLVRPLILRRLKREVLSDLPAKTEITLPVELGDDERHAYEGCRLKALEKFTDGGTAEPACASPEDRISILAELTRLRRFCCHPSLVVPGFGESAKMEALAELLGNLKDNGHKALVFSQFTDYLALVRAKVEEAGWSYRYLDGTVPTAERTRRVAEFQAGEADFFLISLKAGGTGLNLTAANYVILLDPWWNPAVENQAADRAHRIGQRSPVTVYRLIAAGTIEEKVLELHESKSRLAEDLLDDTGSAALTAEELLGLLRS